MNREMSVLQQLLSECIRSPEQLRKPLHLSDQDVAHLNDHGFDICRCDLDGSNTEVLDSVDLGAECRDLYVGGIRIIIGQGRIVVSGFGLQEQLGNDEGTICYVTDLV